MWARLRIHLAETGRRVRVNALWIAAIAASRGLPVVTQDDDFDPVDGVAGLSVIRSDCGGRWRSIGVDLCPEGVE
jgi:predicted nucleic acid-binding protein